MTEAAGRWALAFEQRTDLSSAQGSAAAVVAALRRGADLRLYMTTDSYEETLYFQQTYVRLAAEEGGEGDDGDGACAAGPNSLTGTADADGDVAGFWDGLWHGIIAPITFIISLFTANVTPYDVNNTGGWYNFGFLLGAAMSLGGSGGGAARRRRRKD